MPVKIRIPTPLQKLTRNSSEAQAVGATLAEVLSDLDRQFPGMRERLYDEKGAMRRFINFYVNDEDVRFLKGEQTAVKDGDQVSIVPAIAGGSY